MLKLFRKRISIETAVYKFAYALVLVSAALGHSAFAQCPVNPTTMEMTVGQVPNGNYGPIHGYSSSHEGEQYAFGSMSPNNHVLDPVANIDVNTVHLATYYDPQYPPRVLFFSLWAYDITAEWLNTLGFTVTLETEVGTQTFDTAGATQSYTGPGWEYQFWDWWLPASPVDWWVAGNTYTVTIQLRGIPCDDGFYISAEPDLQAECEPSCNGVGHPINPATGAVYDVIADVVGRGAIPFNRFYNSTDSSTSKLSAKWRHSFSRAVSPNYQLAKYRPYSSSPNNSSIYNDPALACTSGFIQIKNRVGTWQNATANYSNGMCVLKVDGTTIGALPVHSSTQQTPPPNPTLTSIDVMRDDGQLIRFIVEGSSIITPPGTSLKLEQTGSGFKLTDSNDAIEQYDLNGKLLSITSRGGVVQTMGYDASGRLSSVTDSFGHSLSLSYDTQGRLSTVASQ